MPSVYRARRPPGGLPQNDKLQRFRRKILLKIFTLLRRIKKAITFLFLFLLEILTVILLSIFRLIVFPIYTTIIWLNRRIRRLFPENTAFPIALAARRTLPVVFVIILAAINAAYAINAREISPETFGRKTILFQISAGEFIEDFEEVVISDIPRPEEKHYEEFAGVSRPITIKEEEITLEQLATIAAGDTAVLKPALGTGAAEKTRTEIIEYIVQSGDTASSIAAKFGVSINTVLWENNLGTRTLLRLGQKLRVLPTSGVSHVVVSGQNLSRIAKLYSVDLETILRANNLAGAQDVRAGQKLIVPGGRKIAPPAATTRTASIRSRFIPQAPAEAPGGKFLWPTTARRISQYFGWRHTGVDIAGPTGTPLFAAEEGVIISSKNSGWNGGYGRMVIVDHGGGVHALYGHASNVLVSAGQHVSKGQTIALMGSTGRSTGSHLHFEVRINGRRVNPLNYIR